jgi:DNA-binding NarL/FixJ family response regulator
MSAAPPQRSINVLVVEDSPRIAERMRELLLQEPGVEVVDVVSGEEEAIQAVRNSAIDVMILDLQLARGTGFGVLQALGAERPTTIVMTNYSLPQYRARAEQFGVEFFLNKAVDFVRLPDILAQLRDKLAH